MKLITTRFKSGGLHEEHVVATWNLGNHLSMGSWEPSQYPICSFTLQDRELMSCTSLLHYEGLLPRERLMCNLGKAKCKSVKFILTQSLYS